jgi:hypothetical protein
VFTEAGWLAVVCGLKLIVLNSVTKNNMTGGRRIAYLVYT